LRWPSLGRANYLESRYERGIERQLKYPVLGFLTARAMHGYELKAALSPALPRERRVNDGVLYPLLRRLERDGLIRGRDEAGEGGRGRVVYQATGRGRAEFTAWLESGADEQDDVTYDFLVGNPFLTKCLFFGRLGPDEVERKLRDQLERSRAKLAEFGRIRAGMAERGVEPFRIDVLDLGIAQQRARVRWLRGMLDQTETRRAA
jgi:DNA-binding PadR family transcriptional regulator